MRPDEHKKRKNDQYKKKHGMSVKGSEATSKDKEGTKVKQSQTAENDSKLDGATSKPTGKNYAKATTSTDDTDEVEQVFRRRGLVSNWSRYDDLPDNSDDDLPSQKGEDFSKLLTDAGGAIAQFRFRDEEDWNDDVSDSATSSVGIGLNLEDLARSLACVPLQTQLGLQDRLFSDEQLHDLNTVADKNKSLYDSSHQIENQDNAYGGQNQSSPGNTNLSTQGDSSEHSPQTTDTEVPIPKHDKDMSDHVHTLHNIPVSMDVSDSILDNILAESCKKTNSGSQPLKPPDIPAKSKIVVAPDFPVTLDTGAKNVFNEKETLNNDVAKVTVSDSSKTFEDDIDFLLSLDSPSSNNMDLGSETNGVPGKSITSKNTNPAAKSDMKKEDNLEDWLDSMLGD